MAYVRALIRQIPALLFRRQFIEYGSVSIVAGMVALVAALLAGQVINGWYVDLGRAIFRLTSR